MANDEANSETEEQQPKESQVVDLSEEQHDEGDHADAGTAELQVKESHVDANATQQLQPQDNAAVKVTTSTKHKSK